MISSVYPRVSWVGLCVLAAICAAPPCGAQQWAYVTLSEAAAGAERPPVQWEREAANVAVRVDVPEVFVTSEPFPDGFD